MDFVVDVVVVVVDTVVDVVSDNGTVVSMTVVVLPSSTVVVALTSNAVVVALTSSKAVVALASTAAVAFAGVVALVSRVVLTGTAVLPDTQEALFLDVSMECHNPQTGVYIHV